MNKVNVPIYSHRINQFKTELAVIKKKHASVSIFRLVSFLGILISWLYIITLNLNLGILLGSTFVISFFVLLKWHKRIEDRKAFHEELLKINEDELACCNNDFSNFKTGDEFIDHNHPYSYDIDLFGVGSLFQYLNRTVTFKGNNLLAKWLSDTPLETAKLKENQEAIAELAEKLEFRQEFQTIGSLFKSGGDEELKVQKWLNQFVFFSKKATMRIILWVIPILLFIAIAGAIFTIFPGIIIGYLFILNLVLVGSRIKTFNQYYSILNQSHQSLKKIQQLIQQIEKQEFKGNYLLGLQQKLYQQKNSASDQIGQLTKLLDGLDNRNNLLVGVLLNGFLLWDWQCVIRIEKWQQNHQVDFTAWMEVISNLDALNSLANLSFNNPDFNFPEIGETNFEFAAQEMGHPLLPADVRVCNNFDIDDKQRYAIVTGANMAGKSTFLRTIATNLVLAGCGSVVCAKNLVYKPLPLFSSMRTEDSLMKNESYFFAELKRLQRITKELDKGEKLFIILDEILRGTNSEDKRKGSIGFVKKITEKSAHGLVATHDLELARLAEQQPNIFKALCFEVAIENNELQFNYKLQPGVTQNMNASFLMKRMGIIDS